MKESNVVSSPEKPSKKEPEVPKNEKKRKISVVEKSISKLKDENSGAPPAKRRTVRYQSFYFIC